MVVSKGLGPVLGGAVVLDSDMWHKWLQNIESKLGLIG